MRAQASEVEPYPRTQKIRDGSTWENLSAPTMRLRRSCVRRQSSQRIGERLAARDALALGGGGATRLAAEVAQQQDLAAVVAEVLKVVQQRPVLTRLLR